MATHSSVLAWRIPGTGEPGGLPSMGHTELDTTEATLQHQQQQWLRIHLPMQETQAQSPAWKDPIWHRATTVMCHNKRSHQNKNPHEPLESSPLVCNQEQEHSQK